MDNEIAMRRTTCHTEGCENQDLGIEWECLGTVICGACGEQITDIVVL